MTVSGVQGEQRPHNLYSIHVALEGLGVWGLGLQFAGFGTRAALDLVEGFHRPQGGQEGTSPSPLGMLTSQVVETSGTEKLGSP